MDALYRDTRKGKDQVFRDPSTPQKGVGGRRAVSLGKPRPPPFFERLVPLFREENVAGRPTDHHVAFRVHLRLEFFVFLVF